MSYDATHSRNVDILLLENKSHFNNQCVQVKPSTDCIAISVRYIDVFR